MWIIVLTYIVGETVGLQRWHGNFKTSKPKGITSIQADRLFFFFSTIKIPLGAWHDAVWWRFGLSCMLSGYLWIYFNVVIISIWFLLFCKDANRIWNYLIKCKYINIIAFSYDIETELISVRMEFQFCWVSVDICCVQELPSAIGQLKSLTHLNVDRNRLQRLPVEVEF